VNGTEVIDRKGGKRKRYRVGEFEKCLELSGRGHEDMCPLELLARGPARRSRRECFLLDSEKSLIMNAEQL
jgi:hypothetical protein